MKVIITLNKRGALKRGCIAVALIVVMLSILFAIYSSASPVQYEIVGDSAQWDNEYGSVKVTPHTMLSPSGEWQVELTSLVPTQDIDCAFVAPQDAFEFNTIEYYGNKQKLVPSEDYMQYWNNDSSSWKTSANKQPNGSFHYETAQDWIDIKDKFSKASCLAGKTCYQISIGSWPQGSLKKLKVQADVAPDSAEEVRETPWFTRVTHKRSNIKFDFACKRASDTWAYAYASGLMFLVDPFAVWNQSSGSWNGDYSNTMLNGGNILLSSTPKISTYDDFPGTTLNETLWKFITYYGDISKKFTLAVSNSYINSTKDSGSDWSDAIYVSLYDLWDSGANNKTNFTFVAKNFAKGLTSTSGNFFILIYNNTCSSKTSSSGEPHNCAYSDKRGAIQLYMHYFNNAKEFGDITFNISMGDTLSNSFINMTDAASSYSNSTYLSDLIGSDNIYIAFYMQSASGTDVSFAFDSANITKLSKGMNSGNFTSAGYCPLLGTNYNWSQINYSSPVLPGTGLSMQARFSNNNATWNDWSGNYTNGQANLNKSAACMQWKATLNSEGTNTPLLSSVNVSIDYTNRMPAVSSVSLSPLTAYTSDDLNCSFIVSDADEGDSLSVNVSWYNGTLLYNTYVIAVANGTEAISILKAANTSKGETWNCSVIAYDGTAYSNASSTAGYINNSVPNITSYNASNATYTDTLPYVNFSEGENITFRVEASDADSDTLSYSWFLDGSIQEWTLSWFSHFWNYVTAGLHTVRVNVSDTDNAITTLAWNVDIANVVNKFWSVGFVEPPTPVNGENLASQSVNISVLVTPSLIGTAEAKTIFHNATVFTGVHNFTEINTTEKAVQLSYPYLTGIYTSIISDIGENVIWDNISWSEYLPSDGELEPQTGMAGLWHMNNNWLDSSGYNNDGTASGATFTTDRKLGSHAGSFDGIDDYVSVPSSSGDELDIKSDMSVTAWIKWKGPSDPPDLYYPRIMEKDYVSSYMFSLRPDDATRLSVWLQGVERASTPSGSVSLNEWHLVGFTFNDTSDAVKVYVDGVEKGSGSYTGAISGSANNVFIGRYPGGSVALFNGSIDDMAIWNRSLTAEEIQSIYNATAGGIRMQTRSCDDEYCVGESFTGPTGTSSYYTNASYETLSNLQPNKYFQYKAFLETSDASVSPLLYNVTVKGHTQQAIENVSINNAWIDFDGTNIPMSGSGYSWSYANNTLGIGSYSYKVYVNDSFGNVNMTEIRTFSVPSYNITFNVTSGEDGSGINNVNISSCSYSGFNQLEDTTNLYGPYTFPVGTWSCTFVDSADQFYTKTSNFNADDNKILPIIMERKKQLTIQEHDWLSALYNCILGGDCTLYKFVNGTYQNVSRIWQEFIPTNISVVANETFISKTLNTSSNISIDYIVHVPYKRGVEDKALLPIRIFYWFTNTSGACYSQDKQTTPSNRAEYPFCIPLIAEYLGPNNGSVNFKVELKPNLPPGTYEVVRQIDIDPPVNGEQVWINYGREAIGSINVLNEIVSSVLKSETEAVVEGNAPNLPRMDAITGGATLDIDGIISTNMLIALAMVCFTVCITVLGNSYLRRKQ